jgi:hypothetical protein
MSASTSRSRLRRVAAATATVAVGAGALFGLSAVVAPGSAEAKPRTCSQIEADFDYWANMYNKFNTWYGAGNDHSRQIMENARGVLAEGRDNGC